MLMFLRCVGEAIAAQGVRALAGLVPLGDRIYDIAADAIERYRHARLESQLRPDAEEVIQASTEQVREEAHRIAAEVLPGHSPEEIARLEHYLTQVPAVARQTLRRPSDATGRTIPSDYNLLDPVQLANLLPQRLPRFQTGETVPHAPQWRFVDLLGAGGFGEVWLARHSFLDQLRAVKFCLDPTARERLLKHEGEVVKQVMAASARVQAGEHGIVPLVDAYLEGETPWLAYEYIEGGDLSTLVREHAALSSPVRGERSLQIVGQLAEVIGRFHTLPQPIIHRDLKPANILLKPADRGWKLRVTDFGISHVAADLDIRQATFSTPNRSLGATYRGAYTPIYASPQQKRGLNADVRDDVHALGIIGWQLLLGDLAAERPAGKWRKRVSECQVPDEALDLLESCWDDDADERPANGAVLAERLRALTSPRSGTPSPISTPPPAVATQTAATTAPASVPSTLPSRFTNAWGMEFVLIPKGNFWMGGGKGVAGSKQVIIDHDFYIGVYPVTQQDWINATGENPSTYQKKTGLLSWLTIDPLEKESDKDVRRFPVESVSWNDCQQYIRKLNEKMREQGWIYRLPTAAEWEYACRGAASSQHDCGWSYYFQTPTNNLSPQMANFADSSLNRPSRVGGYPPNSLGIHDLHGNVAEWCEDQNTGWFNWLVDQSKQRSYRGGSFFHKAEACQAGAQGPWSEPNKRYTNVGLRLVRVRLP